MANNNNISSDFEEYLAACKAMSPEQILDCIERMRDFIVNNMTAEGREFFDKTKEENEP